MNLKIGVGTMRKNLTISYISNNIFLILGVLLCSFLLMNNVRAIENYTKITLSRESSLILAHDKYYIDDKEYAYTTNACEVELTGVTENEIKIETECKVKLSNLRIESKNGAGIRVTSGNQINLEVNGDNNIKGADGYAGISVEKNATVIVNGSGNLVVAGGAGFKSNTQLSTAGAGIGGDGTLISSGEILKESREIGKIIIQSGNIEAKGGDNYFLNGGAGAGIGSGGLYFTGKNDIPANGNIEIQGGTITAQGGVGSGGGSGIGSGGHTVGTGYANNTNNIIVKISGGNIKSLGGSNAAGIGGGENIESGLIYITGGVINALGNSEDEDLWGGAGIGGGDNSPANYIEISNDAKVYAKGAGAAAGIGGGQDSFVGKIADNRIITPGQVIIKGSAEVTAIGGTYGDLGGAGIGSGVSYYSDNPCGSISVLDNASVIAIGGNGAQAIGHGSAYEGDESINSVVIGKGTTVIAINPDFNELPINNMITESTQKINYTNIIYNLDKNSSKLSYYDGNIIDSNSYTYDYTNNYINIYKNKELCYQIPYSGNLGNIAVIFNRSYKITITGDNIYHNLDNDGIYFMEERSITIRAKEGYKITKLTINGVDQTLPLLNDTLILSNVDKDVSIVVTTTPIQYEIVEGNNQAHELNKDGSIKLKTNGPANLLKNLVLCDANGICKELVKDKDYTLDGEFNTVVVLNQEYLNSLSNGTYKLIYNYLNGTSIIGTFSILDNTLSISNPETNDNILKYISLELFSLIIIISIVSYLIYTKKLANKN